MVDHNFLRGFDSIHLRHVDIHQYDCRVELIYQLYCLLAITGFAHEFHIGIGVQHCPTPLAHYEVVIDPQGKPLQALLGSYSKSISQNSFLLMSVFWTVCSSTDKVSHVVHSL